MLERLRLWGRVDTDPRIAPGRAGELGHAVFWIDPADDNVTLLVHHGGSATDWHATASLTAGTIADGTYGDVVVSGLGTVFTLAAATVGRTELDADLSGIMAFSRTIGTQTELRDAVLDAVDSDGVLGRVNLSFAAIDMTGPLVDADGRHVFHQIYGGSVTGHGARGTKLIWGGDPDEVMITLNRCQRVTLRGFSVQCDEPLVAMIRIQQDPTADNTGNVFDNLTSSLNEFHDITVQGLGKLGVAFDLHLVDPFSGHDDKNDHMKFEGCQVTGARWAAFVLEGRNAKAIFLRDCWVSGTLSGDQILNYGIVTIANYKPTTMQADGTILAADIGDAAINGGDPVFNHGASFVMDGRQLSGIAKRLTGTAYETGWNVIVGDRNEAVILRNLYGEKDQRLLYVPRYPDGVSGESGAFTWELDNVKYVVNDAYPAPDEVIVEAWNGSGMIRNCEHGQRVAGQQVRYSFNTPVGGPGCYSMQNVDVANDGDGNVFTAEAPANTGYEQVNRGYRAGVLARLGSGIVVPTDGPSNWPFPESAGQWEEAGLVAPSSGYSFTDVPAVPAWSASTDYVAGDYVSNDGGKIYKYTSDGTSASSGGPTGTGAGITDGTATASYYGTGTGVIRDLFSTRDLLLVGTIDTNQSLASWVQQFILLTETAGESAQLNSAVYDPGDDAVTVVFPFRVVASGGTRKLYQFGGASTAIGGHGGTVAITSAGLIELNINGTTANGATNYEGDGTVHLMMIHYDPAGGLGAFVATDAEKVAGTPDASIAIAATNGIGASSGTAVNAYVGAPKIWYGDDARTMASPVSRTILGINAT